MSDQGSQTSDPKWVWWSTHETIQNEVPSVTAIIETIIAVPLYWWIALHTGLVLPLLISAAVAPLVLLRSDQSVALGLRWFHWFDYSLNLGYKIVCYGEIIAEVYLRRVICLIFLGRAALNDAVWNAIQKHPRAFNEWLGFLIYSLLEISIKAGARALALLIYFPAGVSIRIGATLVHLYSGMLALPSNFRRLTLCWSPAQEPELVPDLHSTRSIITIKNIYKIMLADGQNRRSAMIVITAISAFMLFLPSWFYRISVKSTAWFWWPFAFLGGDLKQIDRPKLFRKRMMGTLWAKATILMSGGFLVAFVMAHAGPLMFEPNDLLFPAGRLLNIDWTSLWAWQVCGLATAVLSVAVVFLFDEVFAEYQYAEENQDMPLRDAAGRKFGWIERLARVRTLFALGFWGLVGAHAFLYVNVSQEWWLPFPAEFVTWMVAIYGDRFPGYNQYLLLP